MQLNVRPKQPEAKMIISTAKFGLVVRDNLGRHTSTRQGGRDASTRQGGMSALKWGTLFQDGGN